MPGTSLLRGGDGVGSTEGDKDCRGGRRGKAGAASSASPASSSEASGVNCCRGAAGGAVGRAAIGDIGAPPPSTFASDAAGPCIDAVRDATTGEDSESDAVDNSGAFLFGAANGDLAGEICCSSI
jgi:hypothetical protein